MVRIELQRSEKQELSVAFLAMCGEEKFQKWGKGLVSLVELRYLIRLPQSKVNLPPNHSTPLF